MAFSRRLGGVGDGMFLSRLGKSLNTLAAVAFLLAVSSSIGITGSIYCSGGDHPRRVPSLA